MCTEGIYHIKEKLTRMLEKLAGKKKNLKKERGKWKFSSTGGFETEMSRKEKAKINK